MGNPTIRKKTEAALTISLTAKKLFQAVYLQQNNDSRKSVGEDRIKVSDFISKVAFYYEKIRNSVDYKEDHLLRKNAIERILKRQIVIEGAVSMKSLDSGEIARHLIVELIRAGYLPNDTIFESKIDEIAETVSRYLLLRHYAVRANKSLLLNDKNGLTRWVISIAASDIEGQLGRNPIDLAVVEQMYAVLSKNIKLSQDSPYSKDKDIQIFLGIHRNFLKYDRDMLSLILFKYFNADWDKAQEDAIETIAKEILSLRKEIDEQLDKPLGGRLKRVISRYTVFFSIFIDVISEDPSGIYESFKKDPLAFPRKIKQVCASRYKTSRAKLWRAAIRSIIYIFITKSIFVIILEVPAIKFFGEEVNIISLAINIGFPALLLFLIVFFTKLPSEQNTKKIIEGVEEIVFVEKKRAEPFQLGKGVKRSVLMNAIFGFIYAITFFVSFGAIIWTLQKINFNWVSIIIFLFFLAFVSFFSIRIRKSARGLILVPPKENILSFFADIFYVPIVLAGKWLSEKFSRINVFVFVLDFIIEAPFKIFVEMAEEWTNYVKERKEDIL